MADLVAAVLAVAFLVLAGLLPFLTTSVEGAVGSAFSIFPLESVVAGFPWSAIRPSSALAGTSPAKASSKRLTRERPIEWTWR